MLIERCDLNRTICVHHAREIQIWRGQRAEMDIKVALFMNMIFSLIFLYSPSNMQCKHSFSHLRFYI